MANFNANLFCATAVSTSPLSAWSSDVENPNASLFFATAARTSPLSAWSSAVAKPVTAGSVRRPDRTIARRAPHAEVHYIGNEEDDLLIKIVAPCEA